MELKKFKQEIYEAAVEQMKEAIACEETTAYATINTDAGWLDISTNDADDKDCIVCHDDSDNENECRNIAEWVMQEVIPDWYDVVDDYEWEHRDDRHDGLDPAFSSWEEVNEMFFRRY